MFKTENLMFKTENLLFEIDCRKRGEKIFDCRRFSFVSQFNKTKGKLDFHLRLVDFSAAENLKDQLNCFS